MKRKTYEWLAVAFVAAIAVLLWSWILTVAIPENESRMALKTSECRDR